MLIGIRPGLHAIDAASRESAEAIYDAILIVGFGGPESREDVTAVPGERHARAGVPRERLLAVAEHYYHFGGVSPINAQVRELIAAL